jgi:hypothetical protein
MCVYLSLCLSVRVYAHKNISGQRNTTVGEEDVTGEEMLTFQADHVELASDVETGHRLFHLKCAPGLRGGSLCGHLMLTVVAAVVHKCMGLHVGVQHQKVYPGVKQLLLPQRLGGRRNRELRHRRPNERTH